MKTNYLIPRKYKPLGWILLVLGIIGGLILFFADYESDVLEMYVLSVYNGDDLFESTEGFFKIIKNDIIDEIIALAIIIGGLIVGFSREKIEDEMIFKLRKDSLVWALLFNYLVLALAIIFIYSFTFFDVLVFNMFTPLLFFIARFNFMKHKLSRDEE